MNEDTLVIISLLLIISHIVFFVCGVLHAVNQMNLSLETDDE